MAAAKVEKLRTDVKTALAPFTGLVYELSRLLMGEHRC